MTELLLGDFLRAFFELFVVLDPISVAPIYVSRSATLPPTQRRRLLNMIVMSVFVMLVLFAVIGDLMFKLLGVSIADFKIAAGIILLVYAVASFLSLQLSQEAQPESLLVPIATPLLAGPGSVTVVIYIKQAYGYPLALTSLVLNVLLIYPIFRAGDKIVELLGKQGILLLDKFMNLIIAGFAISLIRMGVIEIAGLIH
jgi:multiple antibiotic resistance protein